MYAEAYIEVLNDWWKNHILWSKGEHPDQKCPGAAECQYYSQWAGNPPDINSYHLEKWTEKEAACFQLYENVSEGTPVSPVFESLKALENWLVEWQGYARDAAKEFCKRGWAPTFIVTPVMPTDSQMVKNQPVQQETKQTPDNLSPTAKKLMDKKITTSNNPTQKRRQ